MRRILALCTVVAVVACAKNEQAADTTAAAAPPPPPPPALTAADLTGTWDMKTMAMDRDTVLTTGTMTSTGAADGWTMTLGSSKTPIPVRIVSMGGDSVVSETGQFSSALRRGQKVSIHSIQRLRDGKLTGVVHAKYANGDTATFRIESTKRATP
jgi:hypothetical protein